MKIGAMNHPGRALFKEMEWMARLGLDFIDLTLEPPAAWAGSLKSREVRKWLSDQNLEVVGHTAWYLPVASPFESIRRAAVDEFKQCLEFFAEVGAPWVNIHPDWHAPFHEKQWMIRRNLETLSELLAFSRECGIGMMIENTPGEFNNAAQIGILLEPLPELGLHLDIGHCNLRVERNTTAEILQHHAARLKHVHLHDNKGGGADLHLPLGVGTLDWAGSLRLLKSCGYTGPLTLEVFSPDRNYLGYSKKLVLEVWNEKPSEIFSPLEEKG
jgi:sugar phosphate isomerase/epimerase